jgi:hypothetical protein
VVTYHVEANHEEIQYVQLDMAYMSCVDAAQHGPRVGRAWKAHAPRTVRPQGASVILKRV